MRLSSASLAPAVEFEGEVLAVKGRIRLLRSFDEVAHQYQGYTLVLRGTLDGKPMGQFRVAVGPAAHAKHQFRIGDQIRGRGHPVEQAWTEWAQIYRTSGLKFLARGPERELREADPDGGIAPPLSAYQARGHLRLNPTTCAKACFRCPFGLTMATEIILDRWNQSRKKWRFETHCYGPKDCPRYRSGPARIVPGRAPGIAYVDEDVERMSGEPPEDTE